MAESQAELTSNQAVWSKTCLAKPVSRAEWENEQTGDNKNNSSCESCTNGLDVCGCGDPLPDDNYLSRTERDPVLKRPPLEARFVKSVYLRRGGGSLYPHWPWPRTSGHSRHFLDIFQSILLHTQRNMNRRKSWFSYTANVNRKTVDSSRILNSRLREHVVRRSASWAITGNGVLWLWSNPKCTRYARDDVTVSVTIYSVSILFQNHPQRNILYSSYC